LIKFKVEKLNEKVLKVLVFIVIICVGLYFTYPENLNDARKMAYVKAYGTTLTLTLGGVLIGIILGFILAFIKFLGIKPLNFIIDEYIDIIRGTPIVIQLIVFVFVIFATLPETVKAIISLLGLSSIPSIDSIFAAIIALGLNSSAYVAEIVRSGINSVDKGQMEAARAMGLDYKTSMKEIVFPQAIKNILPALANEFIVLFKETSIVGMVGIMDITQFSKSLQATMYSAQPILFAAVIYYASVKFFSLLAKLLEKRLNRHD